jgi:hypothetical protein
MLFDLSFPNPKRRPTQRAPDPRKITGAAVVDSARFQALCVA